MTTSPIARLIALYRTAEFRRFLLVGGLALLANWLARFVFETWVSFPVAVVLAYGVGIVTGFLLNRAYVFPYSDRSPREAFLYFVVVNLAAFPPVVFVAWVLGDVLFPLFVQPELAKAMGHAIAITAPVFFNYVAHKFWTFRPAKGAAPAGDQDA